MKARAGFSARVIAAVVLAAAVVTAGASDPSRPGFDAARCAGFSARDAAPLLGVATERVTAHLEAVTRTLVVCSYAVGKATPGIAFSIENEASAAKAAAAMQRYRDDLELAADTAPWKGKLPKGAYSDIMGDGLGDEAVWTDINGVLMVRKGHRLLQVTLPKAKLDQVKLAKVLAAKL